ncbi:MAG TPA: FtsX-like permease family protein, partial [Gemmatimonadaceae bacterium]|nr:FtsX-like permease family protein [Gemmatimonadaceae bacterium]
IFGALALGIALVGAFGVVSYLAAQRTREIGIRLALGGGRSSAAGLIVGSAVRMVAGGTVAGLVIAGVTAPAIQSMLFETSPRDIGIAVSAAGALLAASIIAAIYPAWRASRLSPLVALRAD